MAAETLRVGDIELLALSDGVFAMPPDFLTGGQAHAALADEHGRVELPVGAFLLPGDQPVLIDAGFGPNESDILAGGNLIQQLRAQKVEPADVAVLAFSHLHPDHTGWLADGQGRAIFPNARILVREGDWDYFVGQEQGELAAHTRVALVDAADRGVVELLSGEATVVAGVTALPAPGHTPGHTVFAVSDRGERALLLGDAIYCPQQLSQPDWDAISDVDPALARKTRDRLVRELEASGGAALGCHFPDLRAARFLGSRVG